MAGIVRRIKAETPLAVTLSLGERVATRTWPWREAGADRYLLRFETSNSDLYFRIHPPRARANPDRLGCCGMLRETSATRSAAA
jgi:biotin synthase